MTRRNPLPTRRSRAAPTPVVARVAGHRARQSLAGLKRVEIIVTARDAALIRQLAQRLRDSPADAANLRTALAAAISPGMVTSGRELVDLLRSGPFRGVDLDLERDRSGPRNVKL